MLRKILNYLLRKKTQFEESTFDYDEGEQNALEFTNNYVKPLDIVKEEHEVKSNEQRIITFEFIPESQNFRNARSVLQFIDGNYTSWKTIRDKSEELSGGVCTICGKTSHDFQKSSTNTECHEVWHYDNFKNIQTLVRLESLCVCCHQIKHISRFFKDKKTTEKLLNRYCSINDISLEQGQKDLESAYRLKHDLKDKIYELDLSEINKFYTKPKFEELVNVHNGKFAKFLDEVFLKNKNIEE